MRFQFGKNWASYAKHNLTEERISIAQSYLSDFLGYKSLEGRSFLDIGSGSGIHSLAAKRLGASLVYSFDCDADSVATTILCRRKEGDPANWHIEKGSILDTAYVKSIPKFDIVYSWGVLHHTGDMWTAIRNSAGRLNDKGLLYISLYAKEAYPDYRRWISIKKSYNSSGTIGKAYLFIKETLRLLLHKLRAGENIVSYILTYKHKRGMSFFHDQVDWLGGYPIEFSSKKEVVCFCVDHLALRLIKTSVGEGCSEFLFEKS
jgi:2-polyprenyl-3-methyl-5-hydroxy-6-metoxy-1,4-benzoquinol methylase